MKVQEPDRLPQNFYRDRCDVLEEQLRQLRNALMPRLLFPELWNLNRGESSILASLYTSPNGFRTKAALQACCEVFLHEMPSADSINVRIRRLRVKLKHHRIVITTRFGEGYLLSIDSISIIRAALEN